MKKYICTNCNYTFISKNSAECDFCGMKNLEEVRSAEGLIDEVDNLFK